MTIVTTNYQRVADTLATQAAELLCASVTVTDERGIIVAGSEPRTVGLPADLVSGLDARESLRVPFQLDAQAGEVIVAAPRDGEAFSPRLAQVIIELVISQTAVISQLPNQHDLKNKFIYDLLHGLIGDETVILREAKVLGMDLVPPRAVILIDAADYILAPNGLGHDETATDPQIRRRVQRLIGSIVSFFKLPNDTICAYLGDGEVAVLKASNTRNLVAWVDSEREQDGLSSSWANLTALQRASAALLARLRADTGALINIGIGRHHPGIRGLARSYQDARAALSLGRCFHGQNQVHCLDGLGIAAFVGIADERTKVDLATHLLSPLDHEPELLQTLDVFFAEDCCPSSTASRLAIHRNTLSYRLEKIASLTGLDPRRFDDAVQIRLALVLRSLYPQPVAGN